MAPLSSYRKLGDGLFLQSCAEVAQLYPKIKYENIIIDNCCMQVHTDSLLILSWLNWFIIDWCESYCFVFLYL